jgi:SAM-dependent methyltransferase
MNEASGSTELQKEYRRRFSADESYRRQVWSRLIPGFFQALVPVQSAVLDLGCGYGEFINQIKARTKYAMDLNPDAGGKLNSDVQFFLHDCSLEWPLPADSLDVVFTSNFFEHLPCKALLTKVIEQIVRCLRPEGRLICLGPNIKYLANCYWDFWDHHIPLSDRSLQELLEIKGFEIEKTLGKFLPFSMSNGFKPSPRLVIVYLKLPWVWPVLGRQFLIVAHKS